MTMAAVDAVSYKLPLDGASVQFTTLTSNFAQLSSDCSKTTIITYAEFP